MVNARRTEKISEVIAREIVRDSRGLPPGAMLPPEALLLEKYEVGRASLREALRLLEVQGLIVLRPGPGGGPRIAEADSSHFGRMASLHFHLAGATYGDTLDARLILEPVVAGIIAEKRDPEHVAALQDYLERSASTVAGGSRYEDTLSAENEIAREFHPMLMEMSGNPVLTLLARSLQELRTDRARGTLLRPESDVTRVHDLIARAIIQGRPVQAERLMREHMQEFVELNTARDPELLEETVFWH